MSIKQILFNIDMVRAILDGRKTVTRRLIKKNQIIGLLPDKCKNGTPEEFLKEKKYMFKPYCDMTDTELINTSYNPPYHPGDILYVRETWCWCPCWDCGMDTDEHNCCDETARKFFNHDKREYGCYCYKASCDDNEEPSVDTWHPSIHMPKEAARIWMKVKEVRVERLQVITVDGIRREGVGVDPKDCAGKFDYETELFFLFQRLWDSTIKKSDIDRYGWGANPWVWVIEFERCEKPEGI